MITKSNLKVMLNVLEFTNEHDDNVYEKEYHDGTVIKVNLKTEQILYPENKIKVNEKQTCNFSENENFVVLECVDRLLSKGYFAENIELEKKWPLGRNNKGGRADIFVSDRIGDSLLIIECKTAGPEYRKEWARMQVEPSQLISYAWQERKTSYICLYSSDLSQSETEMKYQNYVVYIKDNQDRLLELASVNPPSYKDAGGSEELFNVWRTTYAGDYKTVGIFENDIPAYMPGKKNYSIDDLDIIELKDIQTKYHEFATILRQHNVSGKENAFDKLVNLFLCKIVDETNNISDLQFSWKGVSFDTPFELQDRLQKLYKEGMAKFLQEDITYIDNKQIDHAFRLFKNDPDATKDTIRQFFKELKFFTNNDFAFIEVHNERLFYQNANILLKVVRMLEKIRLVTDTENQFLGDLFEGFLDQGIKQSEGQYFTPMPIVKYIISSLPINHIIEETSDPIKVLDYACGAGHFLNEYALYLRQALKSDDLDSLYSNIYGIEKEYRLSKVAKVSSFMYGQDNVHIVYGDTLSSLETKGITPGSFDILISNPPYSVKGFLETLTENDRNKYELIEKIKAKSYPKNDSIETFFIERAGQLLKGGGLCAIIVPSTIISNSSKLYEATRELILRKFELIAISEFGSQTFGQTNTNTITLFMKKRPENPSIEEHYVNRVNSWFSGDFDKDNVFEDDTLLEEYILSQGYDSMGYIKFLEGNMTNEFLNNDIITSYKEDWSSCKDKKNLEKKVSFKKASSDEQKKLLEKSLIKYISLIEREKLYYFMLASQQSQPVVVIKSPSKNAAQKEFLGYEWSKAKGNEGIKIHGKRSTEIIKTDELEADDERILENLMSIDNIDTPLYNPKNLDDIEKINSYIKANFLGDSFSIPSKLDEYITVIDLLDMLDFSMGTFDKKISTVKQSTLTIKSPYSTKKLKKLVSSIGGLWTGEKPPFVNAKVIRNTNFSAVGAIDTTDIAEILVEKNTFNKRRIKKGDIIIEKSGGSETQAVGRVVYFNLDEEENYSFSNFTARFRVVDNDIKSKYLYYVLRFVYQQEDIFYYQTGSSGLKNLNMKKYLEISIPVPDPKVQDSIIEECEKIDEEFKRIRKDISEYQEEIQSVFKQHDIVNATI